jgi:hypothetical protein
MAGKLSNSWTLVKASTRVLALDKELMVFPVLSGVATVLVIASFALPLFLTGGWTALQGHTPYVGYVLGFLFYLVQYTVIFFFNSALVGAALVRLEGGDPTVSDGLGIAMSRLGSIVGYAALAATVGMVLQFISERVGVLGRIVTGLVGIAWTLATYLAVPVLVTQDVGPLDAVKKSAELFKGTWGEQVIGNFGIGAAVGLMAFSWTIVVFGLLWLGSSVVPGAILPTLAVAVLGYVLLGLFASTLKGIYTAALYRYATHGEAHFFDAEMLSASFKRK